MSVINHSELGLLFYKSWIRKSRISHLKYHFGVKNEIFLYFQSVYSQTSADQITKDFLLPIATFLIVWVDEKTSFVWISKESNAKEIIFILNWIYKQYFWPPLLINKWIVWPQNVTSIIHYAWKGRPNKYQLTCTFHVDPSIYTFLSKSNKCYFSIKYVLHWHNFLHVIIQVLDCLLFLDTKTYINIQWKQKYPQLK